MKRIRHLVAYDIRDSSRLRLVHKKMKGFGFSMQYSVFICDLTSAERLRMMSELGEIIDSRVDCLAVVPLGEPGDRSSITFIGPRPAIEPPGSMVV